MLGTVLTKRKPLLGVGHCRLRGKTGGTTFFALRQVTWCATPDCRLVIVPHAIAYAADRFYGIGGMAFAKL